MDSFLMYRLVRTQNLCRLDGIFLTNAVAQSLGGRDPEVVPLKVDTEDVVVRRSALYRDLLYVPAASRTSISGLCVSSAGR